MIKQLHIGEHKKVWGIVNKFSSNHSTNIFSLDTIFGKL